MKLTLPDRPADWQDCYRGALAPPCTPARAVFGRALSNQPKWVPAAMQWRNRIVRPFGLVTEAPDTSDKSNFLQKMPVAEDAPNRFVTGMTDRHLTFTITTECEAEQVTLRTHIWFHHWAGRIYLAVVWPAHMLILKGILRNLAVPSPEAAQ